MLPLYDLGISYFYNHLIPEYELVSPSHIWLNFHPAPLPQYRGRNVAYHAILNGETEFGATLHYVAPEFDMGDIIAESKFPILESHTAGDIAFLARQHCLDLFKRYIPCFLNGEKIEGRPQGQGRYYRKEPISPYVPLTSEQQRLVRAITASPHCAKTVIGGIEYVIKPANSG